MSKLYFDRTKWPKVPVSQHRWSQVTHISLATLQKARERGELPAKTYERGLNVVHKISREDFEIWFDNHYVPNLRRTFLRGMEVVS